MTIYRVQKNFPLPENWTDAIPSPVSHKLAYEKIIR